jgi:phosphoglycolate phosphatase
MHVLVLFDLDGTISDPLVGIGRSINYALAHFGYPTHAFEELSAFVGPPLDEAFKSITGVAVDAQVEALVAKYRERYAEVGYSENILYPGIPEALAGLREAGVPLGLCTSKRKDFAERILEMFGLRSHFGFVSGGEIGVQKWQQIEALVSQGLVSRSSVMVGDRAVDIAAAHRNGLQAAGVLWGYGTPSEIESERPHYVFRSPDELLSLAAVRSNAVPTV